MAVRSEKDAKQKPAFTRIIPPSPWRRQCRLRGIGNRSVLLILLWSFMINFSAITWFKKSLVDQDKNHNLSWRLNLGLLAFALVIPITGLLAEVAVNRYKLVCYSLKAMWLISIAQCISSVIVYSLELSGSHIHTILIWIYSILTILVYGAFGVSAVPLGVDQLTTGTDTNISAFLMWGVWSIFGGKTASFVVHSFTQSIFHCDIRIIDVMLFLLSVVLLSLGLILDFFYGYKLIQEPLTENPITLIYKVLKYAAKHKNPVRRSAFTYCENEQPSRLDNGKAKYGGPFTTEQVEDVKTFWRILPVLFAISLLLFPLLSLQNWQKPTHNIISPTVFTGEYMIVITLGIPVYELVVYPCVRNRGLTILQSTLIGVVALIVSSLFGLATETIQYLIFHNTKQHQSYQMLTNIPTNILLGFVNTVVLKMSLEFVCAQGPYNTKRILIGFFLSLYVLLTLLSALFYEEWENKVRALDGKRSGIWFYLFTLVLTVLLSILLGYVVKRYKRRERDEITGSQTMREDIYYKYQEQEDRNGVSIQSY